jgi:hypothetical protein
MRFSLEDFNWWIGWACMRIARTTSVHDGNKVTHDVQLWLCLPWYYYRWPAWIPRVLMRRATVLTLTFDNEVE